MKGSVVRLVAALVLVAPAAFAAEVPPAGSVEALEARIAQLEARDASASGGEPSRLTVNGFISAGFARVDSPWLYDGGQLSDTWSHTAGARAGLQFGMPVTERLGTVLQLLARGSDDFAVEAEWAYASYAATDHDELRVGRQRLPLFMLSEYLDVGYARPWVAAPIEAYNPDLPSAYDGISWRHRINGDWSHELLGYAGSTRAGIGGGDFSIDDMFGVAWFASRGDLTLRAGYAVAQTSFSNPMLSGFEALAGSIDREEGSFGGIGAQYDGERVLLLAEYQQMKVGSWFPDYAQGYATLGVHLGKWMPHLTLADVEITDKDQRYLAALPAMCPPMCMDPPANTMPFPANTLNTLLDSDQQSVTLGVRYDFLANAAAKLDWTRVLDTEDTWGRFTPPDGNYFGQKPAEDVDVFRFAVDVVF